MSAILYYSNFCDHSKRILQEISRSQIKEGVHFICIDKRTKKNGSIYIILGTEEIFMPPNIVRVPSLLLLTRGNIVIEGDDVLKYIVDKKTHDMKEVTNGNEEPTAFSLNTSGFVVSDNFSFLDQNADDLTAKGEGGTRQMHNYVPVNSDDNIETPPDTYTPDTISHGSESMESILARRANDVPTQQRRM